jgi:hypothetical protein
MAWTKKVPADTQVDRLGRRRNSLERSINAEIEDGPFGLACHSDSIAGRYSAT